MRAKNGPLFARILFGVFLFVAVGLTNSQLAAAQSYSGLTIAGQYSPSTVGMQPVTSPRSWLSYQFLGGARFTWYFGPGTDGGIVFNKAQGYPPYDNGAGGGLVAGDPGQLGGEFLFLNNPSVLFSASPGITIDASNTIHMDNLWLMWGQSGGYSLGAGVAGSAAVPLVSDITALGPNQSGWQLNPDGSYHLIYHTIWLSQPMDIHLTGNVVPAPPTVTGIWPGNGNPGAFIFVFGSNFVANATQVSVNGVNALVQVVDQNMLIFILPSGNTMGPVIATTAAGSASSPTNFGIPITGLSITGIWPAEGPVGKFVFVFGSGFIPNATQAALNGISAPTQVVDQNMLLFIVPSGATTGPVTVTTSNGSATSSGSFTVK